jgi:two-component system nitrate/nitrite response regulator NarL
VPTDREREIIQLIVTGVSNKELSRRLGIAEGTAKVHLHNIYEKLGITK